MIGSISHMSLIGPTSALEDLHLAICALARLTTGFPCLRPMLLTALAWNLLHIPQDAKVPKGSLSIALELHVKWVLDNVCLTQLSSTADSTAISRLFSSVWHVPQQLAGTFLILWRLRENVWVLFQQSVEFREPTNICEAWESKHFMIGWFATDLFHHLVLLHRSSRRGDRSCQDLL